MTLRLNHDADGLYWCMDGQDGRLPATVESLLLWHIWQEMRAEQIVTSAEAEQARRFFSNPSRRKKS